MTNTLDITIHTEEQRNVLLAYVKRQELPMHARVSEKLPTRSQKQNRWYGMVMTQMGKEGDQSSEEYRAECKLNFGAPILCRDSERYKEAFDACIDVHCYEDQLKYIRSFSVTRGMNVKQMTEYMELLYRHFSQLGFWLKHPDDLGR